MTQTFVYNGKEVFLTGRVAKRRGTRGSEKVLHEILPKKYINKEVEPFVESQWVAKKELYAIEEEIENNDQV